MSAQVGAVASVRLDHALRAIIEARRVQLEAAAGQPHTVTDAMRDLLRAGATRLAGREAGYESGYVNGFFAAHREYLTRGAQALDGLREIAAREP